MELTYMALKLTLTRKLRFLDAPTYRWYRDGPEHQSKSKYYMEGAPEGIDRMIDLNPPMRIRRRLAQKYAASLHFLSDWERTDGNYRAAWRHHLKSLLSVYGIKYLAYTRHLVRLSREPRLETRSAERRQAQALPRELALDELSRDVRLMQEASPAFRPEPRVNPRSARFGEER
jgi:hypothetical protein